MEDGFYLAVSCYVYVVFCLFLHGWVDAFCVYAAYQRGGVEHGFECGLSSQRLLLFVFFLLMIVQVAVFYLAAGALALGIFMFASFWIYHYVDLDHDYAAEPDTDAVMLREYDRLRL